MRVEYGDRSEISWTAHRALSPTYEQKTEQGKTFMKTPMRYHIAVRMFVINQKDLWGFSHKFNEEHTIRRDIHA